MKSRDESWIVREGRVVGAFESLADRVRRRIPELVSRSTVSFNNSKYLHVGRTFGLPGRWDEALVLSAMFRIQDGVLKLDSDLMEENGPILAEISTRELNKEATAEEIDVAVEAVVALALDVEPIIIRALDEQRG